MANICTQIDGVQLVQEIRTWARELGFSQIGVAGVDLSDAEDGFLQWLCNGFHGEMGYMEAHGLKRARPAELVPGTLSVITARMDYLPQGTSGDWQEIELSGLKTPSRATISLYARGRDYHKVLRARLQKLSERIQWRVGNLGYRVFADSAPVLEAELAVRGGLGWRGKHTLVISREAGSMFFLGEIFVDLALPPTVSVQAHCGSCQSCIQVCPTGAILAPGILDARRCISYLTIEHQGSIDVKLRPMMGNRIYGCDDCQLICPWNKYAKTSKLPDFEPRPPFEEATLLELFSWGEEDFLRYTEGSPMRRIGHVRWLRNLAVALGNSVRGQSDHLYLKAVREALIHRLTHPHELVREHVQWALEQFE